MLSLVLFVVVAVNSGCASCTGGEVHVGNSDAGRARDAGGGDGGRGDAGARDAGLNQHPADASVGLCSDPNDPGCVCTVGDQRSCFSADAGAGQGTCHAGLRSCVQNGEFGQWGPCEGEVVPMPEQCNGLDDDCNGQVDDLAAQACTTSCGPGQQTCIAGVWGSCSANHPLPEACNGVDDNCDGLIDNGLTRGCTTACGSGMETCSAGTWGACSAKAATPETCNGVDDDCDGVVDNGVTQACTTSCGAGRQTCFNGAWGSCSAPTPVAETCNGLDDNCNGQIDDGLSRGCSSKCGVGTETCAAGAWGSCSARQPLTEICGNGIDEDCSGADLPCACIRTPSLTAWQINFGEPPTCWPQQFATNGAAGEYQYSTIPSENDPGWGPHSAPNISFNDPSTMCGQNGADDLCTCRAGGDFTYFQTSFDIAPGYSVTSLLISVADVDDGVKITLFNSSHPAGIGGGYAFIGGGDIAVNLASYVVAGSNRVVLTHVDDCCSIRRIANASITLNGTTLNPCPN